MPSEGLFCKECEKALSGDAGKNDRLSGNKENTMGYTPELKELIKKVEATRPERVAMARRGEFYTPLTMEERKEVLGKFHPDYQEDAKQEVRVGPNRGDVFQETVARLLESRSVIRPDKVDLTKIDHETDVLVIGGGGAGTSAAILAADGGCKVIIANKLRHGDSNTIMAEGGIQAATQECDSPYYHYLDTIGGGHFTNQRDLVAALAKDAPLSIAWLEKLGMMFNKYEDGRTVVRHCGGSSRKRLQSAGDMTGAEIMRVVRDEARNRADMITSMEFSPAVERTNFWTREIFPERCPRSTLRSCWRWRLALILKNVISSSTTPGRSNIYRRIYSR